MPFKLSYAPDAVAHSSYRHSAHAKATQETELPLLVRARLLIFILFLLLALGRLGLLRVR